MGSAHAELVYTSLQSIFAHLGDHGLKAPAIELNNLYKYYKLYPEAKDRLREALHPFGKIYHEKYVVLDHVDLKIHEGESVGIVGRNGSGKSTLLKLIAGVLSPNDGTVNVRGKVTALLELGAGLNPEFSGLENIIFYSTVLGMDRDEIDEKLPKIIDFAELGDFLVQPVKTYSSGMKARLGFAVAVHVDPDILILDEVLAVGDVLFRRKCYSKMEEFFSAGKTVLFVSHDSNSVNELCDRAIMIEKGNIVADDEARLVTQYFEKFLFDSDKTPQSKKSKRSEEKAADSLVESKTECDASGVTQQKPVFSPEYIEDWIPTSLTSYGQDGVEIIDVAIYSLAKEKVNVLYTGEEYIYSYQVHFSKNFSNVAFGMKIKSEQGVELTGAATLLQDEYIEETSSGETYLLEWRFTCNLLGGHYFTNCGVTSGKLGQHEIIARIVDSLVFKVKSLPDIVDKQRIYLKQGYRIELDGEMLIERF